MITTADLKAQTRRELADLARNYGVPGWHGLKKDELIEEINKVQRRLRRKAVAGSAKSSTKASAKANGNVKTKSPAKSKSISSKSHVSESHASKVTANQTSASKPQPSKPQPSKLPAKQSPSQVSPSRVRPNSPAGSGQFPSCLSLRSLQRRPGFGLRSVNAAKRRCGIRICRPGLSSAGQRSKMVPVGPKQTGHIRTV